MYDYQENYSRLAVEREKAVYEKLLSQYNALLFAADEGVFEITIRSQAGAIVVPVSLNDGLQLTTDLIEVFTERIDRIERNLNITVAELGSETKSEMKREEEVVEKREADSKQAWAEYEQQRQNLARMAAASAAPPQKRAGRPKKAATPQPEVTQAAGALAAQVPMNHGSTGQAVMRATISPEV